MFDVKMYNLRQKAVRVPSDEVINILSTSL